MNFKRIFQDFNPSKFLVYSSLLLFVIFLGLRLDGFLLWNFFIVFLPLWIWKSFVIAGSFIGMLVWMKHPELRRENHVDLQAMLISTGFHLLLLVFELLLCTNLQYNIIAYRIVFVPLFCMSSVAIVGCVWGFRHERQLEMEIFFSINILQFICISLKWDSVIDWSWVIVLIPAWIVLSLLSICVIYYVIWAVLFVRSPEITVQQRKAHVGNAVFSCVIVVPLLVFLVLISCRLDGYSTSLFTTIFMPLDISFISLLFTSFHQKGGNQWWFGLRKDFCEFLLNLVPALREYGNVSYKFSDALVLDREHNALVEATDAQKKREGQRVVASLLNIDTPD